VARPWTIPDESLAPSALDKHFRAGQIALEADRWEEARAHFDRVLTLDPDHPFAAFNRGLAAVALRDFAQAAADRRLALARDPSLSAWFPGAVLQLACPTASPAGAAQLRDVLERRLNPGPIPRVRCVAQPDGTWDIHILGPDPRRPAEVRAALAEVGRVTFHVLAAPRNPVASRDTTHVHGPPSALAATGLEPQGTESADTAEAAPVPVRRRWVPWHPAGPSGLLRELERQGLVRSGGDNSEEILLLEDGQGLSGREVQPVREPGPGSLFLEWTPAGHARLAQLLAPHRAAPWENSYLRLALVLDGRLLTALPIPAVGSRWTLDAGLSPDGTARLADMLRSGPLPAPLDILECRTLDP